MGVFSLYKLLRFLGSNRNTLHGLFGFNLLRWESIKERDRDREARREVFGRG